MFNHHTITLFHTRFSLVLNDCEITQWYCHSNRYNCYRYHSRLRHTTYTKSEGISLFSLSLVLGTAIGPFFGMLLMNSFSIKILFIICVVLGVISGLLSLFIRIQFQTVKAKMIQYIKRFDFEPLYCERSNTCCNRYDAHWCDLCSNFNLFTSICRRKKLSHSGKLLLYLLCGSISIYASDCRSFNG